jgi:hypothetical protein
MTRVWSQRHSKKKQLDLITLYLCVNPKNKQEKLVRITDSQLNFEALYSQTHVQGAVSTPASSVENTVQQA